jgi:Ser/Thr protein kinase RdoA (MazF antagonist)
MKLNPKTLSVAAQSFGVELSALRPLGGMEGLACEFEQANSTNVLKIVRTDEGNPDQKAQIAEKIDFINYLAEHKVRVAHPVRSPSGQWIETIGTQEGEFLVTASTKAPGEHFNLFDSSKGTPDFFRAWGRVTGQMHAAAKSYKSWQKNPSDGSTPSRLNDWRGECQFFSNWCQDDIVRQKWLEIGKMMGKLPQTRNDFGLIHNDLHPWNFLVDTRGEITVIDFDVCAYYWFIKDIAIALFFANWNGNPGKGRSKDDYLTAFFRNFMEGYESENRLEVFWVEQLPMFTKHHQILLFTVFTDEWKPYNKWQAETLKKWRHQILNDIPVVKLQFL